MKRKLLSTAVALMCAVGAWAQSSPKAGVEVAPGDYYIYNLGSDMYVSKGSSYGTHATVDGAGCVVTISGTTDAYTLHFAGNAAEKYLGDGGWTDNAPSSYTWSFESVAVDGYTNVYKIKDNDKQKYLYWAALSGVDWANEVMVGDMPATLPNGYFMLVPKATRQNIAAATSTNPVDVTYLVTDPDIESSVNDLKWSGDFARQKSAHVAYSGNYLEKWVDAAGALGDVSAYQTLNLPAGTYRLTMAATAERQNSDIAVTGTYIYAGNQQTEVTTAGTYTVDFTTPGGAVQIGMKTVSTTANWVNFDKVRLTCLGFLDSTPNGYIGGGVNYTTQGSAPTGGHTYILLNQTGKYLYNDGVTPRISSTQATLYTLETTGSEFYIRSDKGLLYKQSNSNWYTWTDGGYGDVAKWSATLSDGKYKLQNHNKGKDSYYFAPNSDNENIQCYSDKTDLTGWYLIDVTDTDIPMGLFKKLQQVKAENYDPVADSEAKMALGAALNDVFMNYVLASTFTSTTYNDGVAAINAAVDAYYAARFATIDGSEGGEDVTNWITNPTPTSNANGWTTSQTPTFNSGNNNAEFWSKSAASLYQTINLPQGYYRLTATAFTRTGMSAPLAVTGATTGVLNSMNITTVAKETVNDLASANTWFNNGYGINELDFYVPTTQDVTISLTADNTTGDHWMVWRSFQLTAVGSAEENLLNLEEYLDNAALPRANALLNDASYIHVTGTERTNLQSAVTALTEYAGAGTTAEKVAERKALKYAIVVPYNVMTPRTVKNAYDEYYYENETAARLGADASSVSAPTTAAEAETAAHAINVINYNSFVAQEYADVSGTTLGAWTDDNVISRTAQHWSGDASKEYFEMNTGYNTASAWTMSRQQTVHLSAGSYVLKVAARVSAGADAELSVTVGSSAPIVTYAGHHGDNGKGITTDGVASYDEGTFANTTGRGFEWRYIPFTLDSDGDVTLKFYAFNTSASIHQYVSFCDLGIWTDPKVAARTELLTAINNATAARMAANEGTGIFQIPATAGTTLATAIAAAQSIYSNEDAVLSDLTSATTGLGTAVKGYQNATLNAPSSSTRYKLVLADRGALSFDATGAADEGGYGLPYSAAADYKAQTFFLTQVTGNNYKLSFEDFEGNTRYICKGENAKAGLGNNKIRTTTDAEKALEIKIAATSTANVFNMLNTADSNNKLGSDGGGMYTANNYTSWSIAEASEASVELHIAAGKLATRIFPFTPTTLPEGVEAYSCAGNNGSSLTLEKVNAPEANKPYILYSENEVQSTELTGWGTATADDYTEGYLTGVYTNAVVPAGSYVLQTQNDVQAFYKADGEGTSSAYRVYVTAPESHDVKMFTVSMGDIADAINAMRAAGETTVRYNLAGQRVSDAQKGIVIVNGKKVLVK